MSGGLLTPAVLASSVSAPMISEVFRSTPGSWVRIANFAGGAMENEAFDVNEFALD